MRLYKKCTDYIFLALFTYASWVLSQNKVKGSMAIVGIISMYTLSLLSVIGGV